MTEEQVKDWLYRLRSEIDFMSVNPEHRENFKMAINEGIKAFDTVKEFEKAQIITGGRLNGRAHAYKCGLEDGERKALEKQSDDCVSRQAVLDKAWDVPYEGKYIQVVDVGDIQELPPVTPTRKTGKWIEVLGGCKCPFCDMAFSRLKEDCSDNFCPECGADMRGESNNG